MDIQIYAYFARYFIGVIFGVHHEKHNSSPNKDYE